MSKTSYIVIIVIIVIIVADIFGYVYTLYMYYIFAFQIFLIDQSILQLFDSSFDDLFLSHHLVILFIKISLQQPTDSQHRLC